MMNLQHQQKHSFKVFQDGKLVPECHTILDLTAARDDRDGAVPIRTRIRRVQISTTSIPSCKFFSEQMPFLSPT